VLIPRAASASASTATRCRERPREGADESLSAMLAWGISDGDAKSKHSKTCSNCSNRCRLTPACDLEWPEGEALKVSQTVSAQKLSIKLMQKRDWFEVSGRSRSMRGYRRYAGGAGAAGRAHGRLFRSMAPVYSAH